jgi:hypothetical protein
MTMYSFRPSLTLACHIYIDKCVKLIHILSTIYKTYNVNPTYVTYNVNPTYVAYIIPGLIKILVVDRWMPRVYKTNAPDM